MASTCVRGIYRQVYGGILKCTSNLSKYIPYIGTHVLFYNV